MIVLISMDVCEDGAGRALLCFPFVSAICLAMVSLFSTTSLLYQAGSLLQCDFPFLPFLSSSVGMSAMNMISMSHSFLMISCCSFPGFHVGW